MAYLDLNGLNHFWNNIKDNIGTASDEQVANWLDAHPEATTTVQDGAVTTAKLADGAVTDVKLAQTGGVLDGVKSISKGLENGGSIDFGLYPTYQLGIVHNGNYDNPSAETNTAYSQLFIKTYDVVNIDVVNGYKAMLVYFQEDGTATGVTTAWLTGDNSVNISTRKAFCIEIRRTDNGTITVDEISSVVSAYHSSSYTDSTLSSNGKAADALATGGAIGTVKDDLDSLRSSLVSGNDVIQALATAYQLGYVHAYDYDNPQTSDNTVYSQLFINQSDTLHVDVENGYKALVVYYLADGTFDAYSAWLMGSNTLDISSRHAFCIELRKSDESIITVAEMANVSSVYYSFPLLSSARKIINLSANSSEMLTITESCDINGNGYTIDVGSNADYALYVTGNVTVNVYNLTCKGGVYSAARVTYGATANFYNCEFTGSDMGLSTIRTANTNCWDCVAHDNAHDGFNYHGAGKHTVYNCYGIDNGDDGISNHEECTLKIIGGKWIGNAKAGIAAPTYEAGNTEILDVYCADNVQYGLEIFNLTQTNELVVVQNAIVINSPIGAFVSGYQCAFNNVKFFGCTTDKSTSNGGAITEY